MPISLTKTQVEVYKYILESNQERLASVHAARKKRAAQKAARDLGKAKAITNGQEVEGQSGVGVEASEKVPENGELSASGIEGPAGVTEEEKGKAAPDDLVAKS